MRWRRDVRRKAPRDSISTRTYSTSGLGCAKECCARCEKETADEEEVVVVGGGCDEGRGNPSASHKQLNPYLPATSSERFANCGKGREGKGLAFCRACHASLDEMRRCLCLYEYYNTVVVQ